MIAFSRLRRVVAHGLLGAAVAAPSFALIKFNDNHDELFVTGSAGVSHDSNIFATAGGEGDFSYNAALELEYRRKAGALGVDASLGWDFAAFHEFSEEDYINPHARAEITKDAGRTTGSLTLSAARQSRADSAINLRTTSWNYEASLNAKYPVIERYSLTGQIGWDRRDFRDNAFLFDIDAYSASADLYYVYNSQRDLLAGYRFRTTETTNDTTNNDHAFTVGTTGKILAKLNGTLRLGYQLRESERRDGSRESFGSTTALASSTWTINTRFNVTGQISQDFTTLATDVSVDTAAAGLDSQYSFNARYSAFGGASVGRSRFLGGFGSGRRDTYCTFNIGVAYSMNDHFKASLGYVYYRNWSTLALSDYDRHTISLNLSSRW